jgi:hypothetical protein
MIPAKPAAVLLLLITLCSETLYAQTASPTGASKFPRWVKDLRRAEIVAFGSFPFAIFFSSFTMDTYRSAQNNWDRRYAPWPLKGAGAIDMNDEEHMTTLNAAIVTSLTIALADYLIVRYKRTKAERELMALPEGDLIIIRTPWPAEPPAQPFGEGEDQSPSAETGAEAAAEMP